MRKRFLLHPENLRLHRQAISGSGKFSVPGSSVQFGFMRSKMDRKTAIRDFLQTLLERKQDTQPFSDDASLLLSGRLQSVDAVSLAVFQEEKFGGDFADNGFDQERMDTVNAILSLVEESCDPAH